MPGGEGLSYYGARWYDPKLGRFLSADTIVPGQANPQAFNRYSYVLNNPLKYTDPTGHGCTANQGGSWDCPQNPGIGGLTLNTDVQANAAPPSPLSTPTFMGPSDDCFYGCTNGIILTYVQPGEVYRKAEVPVEPNATFGYGPFEAGQSVVLVSPSNGESYVDTRAAVKVGPIGYEHSFTSGSGAPTVGVQLSGLFEASAQMWGGQGELNVGSQGYSVGVAGSLPQYRILATSGLYLNSVGLEEFGRANAKGYVLQSMQIIGGDGYNTTGAGLLYSQVRLDQLQDNYVKVQIKDPIYRPSK